MTAWLTAWLSHHRRVVIAGPLAVGTAVLVALLAGGASGGPGTAVAEIPTCTGAAAVDLECQVDRYGAIVRVSGTTAAFDELKRAYEREGFVRAGCHPIVHEIGHAAVERYGDDLADVYARGDPFCSAGYFHGVTEQIVVDVGADEFVENANSVCDDLGGHPTHSIYHRNCAHGIGHGFMLVLEGELPEALETCDVLSDHWEVRSCYGGVFMQNVMALGKSKYLRPDEPLYPCAELDRRYRGMCYQKQTGYAAFARDDDYAAVFELCRDVESAFRPACNRGLGTTIAVHNLKQISGDRPRTGLTVGACMLGEGRGAQVGCIDGAVRALINYDHDTDRAVALCGVVEPDMHEGCLRTVEAKRDWPE